jgi:hypothetical protein
MRAVWPGAADAVADPGQANRGGRRDRPRIPIEAQGVAPIMLGWAVRWVCRFFDGARQGGEAQPSVLGSTTARGTGSKRKA